MLKFRAARRTHPGRFSAAFIALAISLAASAYSVALAGAQESIGGGGTASYDGGSSTFNGSGSTSPGGSCSTTGSSTDAGTGTGGTCTTGSTSCSADSSWTQAGSGAGGSCATENCSATAAESWTNDVGGTGGGSCSSALGECSGSGAGSTGGSTAGGSCATANGDSCSATGSGSSSSGGQDASAGAQCTPSAQPSVSIADAQTVEGNSGWHTLSFTLTLSKAAVVPVVVRAATADGSATAASNDYETADDRVVFLPGQTQGRFSVIVNGDLFAEDNETFTVALSEPQPGDVTIADATAIGTIVNDDRRSGTSGGSSSGGSSSGGSGSGGSVSAGGSAGTSGGGAQGSASVERKPRAAAPRCVVPRLRGKTVAKARAALRAANCRAGGRIYRRSAKVAKGRVVNTAPAPGQSRRNGARVAMIVSSGKPLARRLQARRGANKQVKVKVKTG